MCIRDRFHSFPAWLHLVLWINMILFIKHFTTRHTLLIVITLDPSSPSPQLTVMGLQFPTFRGQSLDLFLSLTPPIYSCLGLPLPLRLLIISSIRMVNQLASDQHVVGRGPNVLWEWYTKFMHKSLLEVHDIPDDRNTAYVSSIYKKG